MSGISDFAVSVFVSLGFKSSEFGFVGLRGWMFAGNWTQDRTIVFDGLIIAFARKDSFVPLIKTLH